MKQIIIETTIEHEILKTLVRVGMTVVSHGSEVNGYDMVNKKLIETCFTNFGTLVALLDNFDKHFPPEARVNPGYLNTVKIKKDKIGVPKYSFEIVAEAVETLSFNLDVTDKLEGVFWDIEGRSIHLTQKGLISYIRKHYITEAQKEQNAIELHKSQINTNYWIKILTFVLTGAALLPFLVQGVQVLLNKLQSPQQTESKSQQKPPKLDSTQAAHRDKNLILKDTSSETPRVKGDSSTKK